MNSFLRQSTASQSRAIGPFIDDTDFKTPKTALTIANTDVKLVVNGAASANKNSGGGTHRVNGVYGVTFDATDTATVGEMLVSVVVAGALPVFHVFVVVEEAVFDALFAANAANAATLSSAERNSLIDALMTRDSSNWEASAPLKSLGTAIMKAVHKIAPDPGDATTLQIFRSDGTTVHAEQTIGTDPNVEPIKDIGPTTSP